MSQQGRKGKGKDLRYQRTLSMLQDSLKSGNSLKRIMIR